MPRHVLAVLVAVGIAAPAHAMFLCGRKDTVSGQVKEGALIRLRSTCKPSEAALPISLEDAGQTVRFTGVNVQIVSGAGQTTVANGKGNLIVGYDEMDADEPLDRSGSHNLVVGPYHTYSSYAGAVIGNIDAITAPFAVATGETNTASGHGASVVGGTLNSASAKAASTIGGSQNDATGLGASLFGGQENIAGGQSAVVVGGRLNTASGFFGTVAGGQSNTASGPSAAVLGGAGGNASGSLSAIVGGGGNLATGQQSTVVGGLVNNASGPEACVSGGRQNEASGAYSSVSGGNAVVQSTDSGWSAGSLGATVGVTGFTSP